MGCGFSKSIKSGDSGNKYLLNNNYQQNQAPVQQPPQSQQILIQAQQNQQFQQEQQFIQNSGIQIQIEPPQDLITEQEMQALNDWVKAAPEEERKGQQEALRLILEAVEKSSTSLIFDKLGLTDLPPLPQCLRNQLKVLNLHDNSLTNLTGFPKLPALKSLDVYSNKIAGAVDLALFQGSPLLSKLHMGRNKITAIVSAQIRFLRLKILYLSDNWIQDVKFLQTMEFPALETLSLPKNLIGDLSPLLEMQPGKAIEISLSFNCLEILQISEFEGALIEKQSKNESQRAITLDYKINVDEVQRTQKRREAYELSQKQNIQNLK